MWDGHAHKAETAGTWASMEGQGAGDPQHRRCCAHDEAGAEAWGPCPLQPTLEATCAGASAPAKAFCLTTFLCSRKPPAATGLGISG